MYAAMLAAADDGVGEIVATLEKLGLRQNTFIFFAGDNGATRELRAGLDQQPPRGGSNHPLRGFKFSLFEGGMREPAIMSWPARIPPRQVISEVGATMDVLPTFCAAAGIAAPSDRTIDGRNVLPMVSEKAKSPHEIVFWDSGGQQAARRGNWKLVLNGMDADGSATSRERLKGEDAVFLSDLEADIGEKNNLRRKHPEIVEEMTQAIQAWREEVSNGQVALGGRLALLSPTRHQ
jgi:arylsulfatase A-like enzyme